MRRTITAYIWPHHLPHFILGVVILPSVIYERLFMSALLGSLSEEDTKEKGNTPGMLLSGIIIRTPRAPASFICRRRRRRCMHTYVCTIRATMRDHQSASPRSNKAARLLQVYGGRALDTHQRYLQDICIINYRFLNQSFSPFGYRYIAI